MMLEGCLKSFLKNWGWNWVLRIVQKSLKNSRFNVPRLQVSEISLKSKSKEFNSYKSKDP